MNARLPANALPAEAQKDSTVFTSGNSQAVRIPKEFQLKTKQVKIIQRGNELVIKPKYATMGELLASLPPVDDENPEEWDAFMQTIAQCRKEPAQERDWDKLFGLKAKPNRKTRTPAKKGGDTKKRAKA
jgi:antitoxin VapB